jgi:hypothetical protein
MPSSGRFSGDVTPLEVWAFLAPATGTGVLAKPPSGRLAGDHSSRCRRHLWEARCQAGVRGARRMSATNRRSGQCLGPTGEFSCGRRSSPADPSGFCQSVPPCALGSRSPARLLDRTLAAWESRVREPSPCGEARLGPLGLRPAFLKLDCVHDFGAGLDRGFETLDHACPGDGFSLFSGVGQAALGFLAQARRISSVRSS